MASIVYKLKHPVEWANETVTELEIRRPKGKDLRVAMSQKGNVDAAFQLMSRLTTQPPAFWDEVDGEDIQEVSTIVEGFMGSSRKTGDSGSEDSPGT